MKIREFTLADYETVKKLWKEAGLTLKPSDELPEIKKKLERDPDLFLVAEDHNQIVGAVIGSWDGRRGYIYHLAIDPSRQRQGLGLQLMQEVEKRLARRGATKVNLMVEPHNLQVTEFYARLGYQKDKVIMMAKFLAPDTDP